jgi:hypothetical protein
VLLRLLLSLASPGHACAALRDVGNCISLSPFMLLVADPGRGEVRSQESGRSAGHAGFLMDELERVVAELVQRTVLAPVQNGA